MAISAIAYSNTPLSQTELARLLGVEDATMISMIDRLVKAELVPQKLIGAASVADRIADGSYRGYQQYERPHAGCVYAKPLPSTQLRH
ncbi:MAG TPA: MarR family transcriptional regulator [Noviherbaspirillum sp.]